MSSVCRSGSLAQVILKRWLPLSLGIPSQIHTGCIMEAARKGTRAKADAKKRAAKKEVQVKREFIPPKKRLEMELSGGASPRHVDGDMKDPIDNVWFARYYRWQTFSVRDAITMHRETHHETQIGLPDAYINAYIELNMSTDKKNRYVDNFFSVVQLPHEFESEQQRTVLAISRNKKVIEKAWEMGVTYAAGVEIIKQVQNGEVSLQDYQHFIAEIDTLPELVAIRGLMRRRFPSIKDGTACTDIIPIIERFMKGVEYRTAVNKYHPDFATIEATFGRLSMTDEQLEENLATLLRDIENHKSLRKSGQLVTLVRLCSLPSCEQFRINHETYIKEKAENVKVAAVS
nr:uncharacterized protein LOC123774614 [Procambarus clarkii]